MSTSKSLLSTAPWAVLFPALAFFISVLAFNLFGEGIRNQLQKPDSLFIPRIRKLLSFDIKYMWSSQSRKSRIVSVISIFLVAAVLIAIPVVNGLDNSISTEYAGLSQFNYVAPGTGEAHSTAGFISSQMEELGLLPLDSDKFIHEYELSPYSLIKEQKMVIGDSDELIAGIDFSIRNSQDGKFTGKIYNASKDDLFTMTDFSHMEDTFVMFDMAYYNDASVHFLMNKIMSDISVRGFLLVIRSGEKLDYRYAGKSSEIPIIHISEFTAGHLENFNEPSILVEFNTRTLDSRGMNVIGILESQDPLLAEEAIIIGLPYNYLSESEKDVLAFGLNIMEEICNSKSNRRSLIFMFMDGTDDIVLNGIRAIESDFPYSASKVKLFINLTNLKVSEFDNVVYSEMQAPFTRQYAWSMGRLLRKSIEGSGIGITEAKTVFFGDEYYFIEEPSYNTLFMGRGVATIITATVHEGEQKHNLGELGRIIVDTIADNNY
jgi:peptide/nickel transport system permease protein